MANHEINKKYSEALRKIEINDPVHPSIVNPLYGQLINNDAYLKEKINEHQAEIATETELGHVRVDGETITVDKDGTISTEEMSAENVTLDSKNFDSNNVKGALNELFTSVSDGKTLIAGAVTDKGVKTSPSDTFQQMADNIQNISVGDYSIGDILEFPHQFEFLARFSQVWSITYWGSVHAVAVGSDGYVYSAPHDSTVRKISPNGSQVWSFTEHTDWVNAVAVDNDGYVYSGDGDGLLRKIQGRTIIKIVA